jgi:hypothetical protein
VRKLARIELSTQGQLPQHIHALLTELPAQTKAEHTTELTAFVDETFTALGAPGFVRVDVLRDRIVLAILVHCKTHLCFHEALDKLQHVLCASKNR